MKTTLIFLILLTINLQAQHCPWCGSYLIMVEVRDSATNQIINGLDIVLADSVGNPYSSKWNKKDHERLFEAFRQDSDTLQFYQNLTKKRHANTEFPFDLDSYMLVVHGYNYAHFNKNRKDLILIQDIDKEQNLGFFEPKAVRFERKNMPGLCTHSAILESKEAAKAVTIYVNLNKAVSTNK